MKRTPIRRKTPLQATKPAKGTHTAPKHGKARKTLKAKPRKASERERIYGPRGFQDWLHRLPCIVCGHRGDIHAHHYRSDGMGRKAGWDTIVPLCVACHRLVHDIGRRRFEALKRVDLEAQAKRVQAAWERRNGF